MDQPPSPQARPAQTRARSIIAKAVEHARTHGSSRLPSLVTLAEAASVSRMTMWHAVHEARRAGIVTASRGQPIALVGAADSRVERIADSPSVPWERVAASIARDVLSGVPLPGATMPSHKELMLSHGVCHATIRKALGSLVCTGLLERKGRRLRVTDAPPTRRSRSDLVLISYGAQGQIPFITPRIHEHLRHLEQECSRLNIRLHIITADQIFDVPDGFQKLRKRLVAMQPLGIVLWRIVFMPDAFRILARQVADSSLPFVVLDEAGDVERLLPRRKAMQCRIYSLGTSSVSGLDVGRFLARHGHRKIAFLASQEPVIGFAQRRLDGLRQAFRESGCPDGVKAFAIDASGQTARAVLRRLRMLLNEEAFSSSLRTGVIPDASVLEEIADIIGMLRDPGASIARQNALPATLDSVLACEGITAIVAENDPVALDCLNYLKKSGVPVPQRVSVVGFDDGMTGMLKRMTSYNFGTDDMTRAMLSFLLDPKRSLRDDNAFVKVEFPGRIVERQSSGAARAGTLPPATIDDGGLMPGAGSAVPQRTGRRTATGKAFGR